MTIPLNKLVFDVYIEPKHGAGFYEKVIKVEDLKVWFSEEIKGLEA